MAHGMLFLVAMKPLRCIFFGILLLFLSGTAGANVPTSLLQEGNYSLAKKMLEGVLLQQEAITSNVANAETPGYQRLRLSPSFESQLHEAATRGDEAAINALSPTLEKDPTARASRADGNNVQLELELLKMNQNALKHEYLIQYINAYIQQMNAAISGDTKI